MRFMIQSREEEEESRIFYSLFSRGYTSSSSSRKQFFCVSETICVSASNFVLCSCLLLLSLCFSNFGGWKNTFCLQNKQLSEEVECWMRGGFGRQLRIGKIDKIPGPKYPISPHHPQTFAVWGEERYERRIAEMRGKVQAMTWYWWQCHPIRTLLTCVHVSTALTRTPLFLSSSWLTRRDSSSSQNITSHILVFPSSRLFIPQDPVTVCLSCAFTRGWCLFHR